MIIKRSAKSPITVMLLRYFLLIILSCIIFSSCIYHKDLLNVQSSAKTDTITFTQEPNIYLLQTGDILSIKVSSLDPQSVAIFNKSIGQNSNTQINEASIYLSGYLINDSGFVSLPIIGNIEVRNLSLTDAQKVLETKMDQYYKYASVDVKLMNFRVTVIGEVTRQGTFMIYNPTTNILQVIGDAGGITDLGNRERIRIIRKQEGKTELAYINLHSDELVRSKYYLLQPNDVVYVEPLKAKTRRLGLPIIQISLSAITALILILNYIQRN